PDPRLPGAGHLRRGAAGERRRGCPRVSPGDPGAEPGTRLAAEALTHRLKAGEDRGVRLGADVVTTTAFRPSPAGVWAGASGDRRPTSEVETQPGTCPARRKKVGARSRIEGDSRSDPPTAEGGVSVLSALANSVCVRRSKSPMRASSMLIVGAD